MSDGRIKDIREALEKAMGSAYDDNFGADSVVLDLLAPKIEAALEAAAIQGFQNGHWDSSMAAIDYAVTAGIKELGK